ncbi:glycine dehydrogenase [Acerihabitans arboris]|uniref:Glycine dehydrogenase n=1 Tax=Acerihabitans arboris TaxID=2691583 RepID=A0A845SLM1_9GAMM|nr:glycine dehydrogenase [Acerihabitans arboris]NDL63521.1 glycine dehydrogenase [Acerihabitans arboris]
MADKAVSASGEDDRGALSAALTEKVLAEIMNMLEARGIQANPVQEQMLNSHVRAMVMRSLTGEPLPEIDKSLFDEISADSMVMAEKVVNLLDNLPIEEAYLLSVHFEVAKDNNA